jgi:hypothetical protein
VTAGNITVNCLKGNSKQWHMVHMCGQDSVLGPISSRFRFLLVLSRVLKGILFLNLLGLLFLGTEKYTGTRIISRKINTI